MHHTTDELIDLIEAATGERPLVGSMATIPVRYFASLQGDHDPDTDPWAECTSLGSEHSAVAQLAEDLGLIGETV